jgi:hypothetical protein
MVREMDADFLQWTGSCVSDAPMEMIIEGHTKERHPVKAGVAPESTKTNQVACGHAVGLFRSKPLWHPKLVGR